MTKAASKGCGRTLNYMSTELRDDKQFVLEVFGKVSESQYSPDVRELSERLRNDLDVMKAAVERDPWQMRDAGPELKDNENLILHCVSVPEVFGGTIRGDKIEFCSDRIRGDKAVTNARAHACMCKKAYHHASRAACTRAESIVHSCVCMGVCLHM